MISLNLSADFASRVKEVHGERGLLWLEQLPNLIKELEQRWDFDFVSPLSNLSYGFLAQVRYQEHDVILKMSPSEAIIGSEVLWLKQFPEITPQVLREANTAFMMERINPGLMLKELVKQGSDEEATRIICRLGKELQRHPQSSQSFPHLSEHTQMKLLRGHFDKDLVEKAESLYQDLTIKSDDDVLLHGDLHHDNILKQGEDWKIIDPHGYIGDPVFEIAPLIYNPLDVLPGLPNLEHVLRRRIDIICEETLFDPLRVTSWAFCMTMLSMAWTFEGTAHIPEHESHVARILSSLV